MFKTFQETIWQKVKNILGNKKNILILVSLIVFLVGSGVAVFASTIISPKNIPLPKIIESPDKITNQEIVFKAESKFAVEFKGALYYSATSSPFEINFGKQSGLNEFNIFGYSDTFMSKVLSTEKETVVVEGDYTAPAFQTEPLKDFYTDKSIDLVFEIADTDFTLNRALETVYDTQVETNRCSLIDSQKSLKVSCQEIFGDNDQLEINYSISDRVGNKSVIFQNKIIKYVLLPQITCIPSTSLTNKASVNLGCDVNKAGTIKVSDGKVVEVDAPKKVDLDIVLNEGLNDIEIEFVDQYSLSSKAKIAVTKDTQSPVLNFTFLDTKKKFTEGNYTVGFKANEDVTVTVSIQPYNDFLENTPGVKSTGGFGYSGGNTIVRDISANVDNKFSVKNNMGTCQIIRKEKNNDVVEVTKEEYERITSDFRSRSEWFEKNPGKGLSYTSPAKITPTYFKYKGGYCNFYNSKFVRTTVTVKDKSGNSSVYYCTGLIYDDKISISGEGKTRCSKDPKEMGCEWFYKEFIL